jgi:three-Cys-motif partner protein
MTRRSDPNPAYWEQYGPFQQVKHELIRCYLNGWYPKLGTWAGRVLYVDTHAGRGRYESGDPGSPVLALQTLLQHSYRDKLLTASEFNFLFIERDPANLAALEAELSQLKPFPARVNVETSEGDAFERLSAILNELRRDRAQMAPAFLFVDPYGFKIPAALLGDLMKAGRVELFINVMWRELDMLIQQRPAAGTPHAQTLDEIFGSGSWRTEVIGDGMDERLDRAIPLMARGIGAKWWTSAVRMVTGGQATRYVLLHLTNSDDGRDLMKECAWSVSPAGGFMVRRSDNPDQQFLIKPEPDLRPLRDWILNRLSLRPERWQDLHTAVRPEWWLPKHVNELVRELRNEGVISADSVPGRRLELRQILFCGSRRRRANPRLSGDLRRAMRPERAYSPALREAPHQVPRGVD